MTHVSSHIIIRGNEYGDTPPAPGQTSVEIQYTPSAGLTDQLINQNIAKLRNLADKIYHIEEQPED